MPRVRIFSHVLFVSLVSSVVAHAEPEVLATTNEATASVRETTRTGAGAAPESESRVGYVTAGVGLPDLLNVRGGFFVTPRVSLDLTWGWLLFSELAGAGASVYLLGDARHGTPRQTLLLAGDLRVNVNDPFGDEGGEFIGSLIGLDVGYALHGFEGFTLRLTGGAVGLPPASANQVWSFGPNAKLAVGYAF